MRVRFFSDYSDSFYQESAIKTMLRGIKNQHPEIEIVSDESYTHAVIINAATPSNLKCPPKNTIGLAWEPIELLAPTDSEYKNMLMKNIRTTFLDLSFISWAKRHLSKYYIGKLGHLPTDVFALGLTLIHVDYWSTNLSGKHTKKYPMSLVLSKKGFLPGHLYRHRLARLILDTKLDIHIYGNGCELYPKDNRVKGEFKNSEPYSDYAFSITIENTIAPMYLTEKFLNPISCACVPVYLGAECAGSVYGDKSHIKLSGNLLDDFNTIVEVYFDWQKRYAQCDLTPAVKAVNEGDANIYNFLHNAFNKA